MKGYVSFTLVVPPGDVRMRHCGILQRGNKDLVTLAAAWVLFLYFTTSTEVDLHFFRDV